MNHSLPCPATASSDVSILGVQLDNLSLAQALESIVALIDRPEPSHVCFVNAHCTNVASHNAAYRDALGAADLVLPDGVGIRLAGRLNGTPVRQDLNGTDLFPHLCAALSARGTRMYLLGARHEVVEAFRTWATASYPGITVCGWQHGYFDPAETDAVVGAIARARPDVLLVALGVPRQELWIQQHRVASGARLSIGVGGLFDFYSGSIPRAPLWMRRTGCEWLYRLYQEPRRLWARYLVGNLVFLGRVFQAAWRRRKKSR